MRAIFKHRYVFTAVLTLAGFLYISVQANEQPKTKNNRFSRQPLSGVPSIRL